MESLMKYTVKYVVTARINALYRLELSAFVFAPAGVANRPNSAAGRRAPRVIHRAAHLERQANAAW